MGQWRQEDSDVAKAAGDVSTHSLGFLLHQVVPEVPVLLCSPWVRISRAFLDDQVDLVNPGIRSRQFQFSCLSQWQIS